MEFTDVIRKRRMVRAFTDDPIDPRALDRILDAARRGPTAGFSQGIEFVFVSDPTVKEAISNRPRGFVTQAPATIIVCASSDVYRSRYNEGDKAAVRSASAGDDIWNVPYWYVDAGAAMMLILLAAVNEGLGAAVAGVMGAAGQQRIRDAVGLPENYFAVAMVSVGHEAPEAQAIPSSASTRKRRAVEDVVHRDRW